MGFQDNFKNDPRQNWDFTGDWRSPERGTLLVTNSDAGGLSKVGALWENYTLSFKAKIIDSCVGVIVRGQDLNNYYMFQINKDKIRPHRRAAVPSFGEITYDGSLNRINFSVGWQIFDPPIPLQHQLEGWFSVSVKVRGESVSICINDELVFTKESFLQIPTGKVGFRNWDHEQALVRDVKVLLQ